MDAKRISLSTLAKELGLSKTTISMVLNGRGDHHKINPDTQKRIIELAQKYNYRPNQIARNLIKGKTLTLGFIVPNISDSYYSTAAYHFEDLASEKGYKVFLGSSREEVKREIDLLYAFEDQRVDGIAIASTQHNLPMIQKMFDRGLPIVLFDREYQSANLPTVIIDNYLGMEKLVRHLYETGRKRIGYVGVDLNLTPLYKRREGFSQTYQDLFQVDPKDYTYIINYKNYRRACPEAIDALLSDKVDAVVFETHYLALHGIKRVNELGLKAPEEIKIASFGDHEVFSIFQPQVTASGLHADDIAKSAIDMLMEQIEKGNKAAIKQTIIKPQLFVR